MHTIRQVINLKTLLLLIVILLISACTAPVSDMDKAYNSIGNYTGTGYTRTIFSGSNF